MASITIRRLPERVKSRLRMRAARHGHSMEQEARAILQDALAAPESPSQNLAAFIRAHIEPLGGVELEPLPRHPMREPPAFD